MPWDMFSGEWHHSLPIIVLDEGKDQATICLESERMQDSMKAAICGSNQHIEY